MLRILIIFFCLFLTGQALAAKPSGLKEPEVRPELYTLKNPVEQAQSLLSQLGFYEGKIDGIPGSDLENAIKAYEKSHGLKQTGKVTRDLLGHLENIGRVRALIKRLDQVRSSRQDEARQALLSDPRTRKLLNNKKDDVADPTRDATYCFKSPSSQCLLKEAVESSRAVFEDDLRDWALGEILAAQVRVGMESAAMETASRIKDSRLVIAALTSIAKTHAQEGKLREALSGVNLIPVVQRRLSVLLEVARVYRERGKEEDLRQVLVKIRAGAQSIDALEERLSMEIQAAELLASLDTEKALSQLDEIAERARVNARNGSQVTILRQAASAMASIGYPEWALKVLDKLPDDDARIPVLMSATRSFLKQKRFEAARNTLQRISADRYRAVILADTTLALWQANRRPQALEIWEESLVLANGIRLPFAKNFALAQIADVMIQISSDTKDVIHANKAFTLFQSISDDRMKARGLWDLGYASEQYGFSITKGNLEKSIAKAMADIKSKFSRAWILGDLADEHQESGDLTQARKALKMGLQTTESLKNPWARSRALAKFGAVIDRLD